MVDTTDSDGADGGTICAVETVEGDLLVYDRDEPEAWLQSDTVAALGSAESA